MTNTKQKNEYYKRLIQMENNVPEKGIKRIKLVCNKGIKVYKLLVKIFRPHLVRKQLKKKKIPTMI